MKITIFSTQQYDKSYFECENSHYNFDLNFVSEQLTPETSTLAKNSDAVCLFVNDIVNDKVINLLAKMNIRLIALRCAGFNNVDLKAAKDNKITVVRVPAYSPTSIAEHTVGLILTLNRKYHKAFNRVREGNFSLSGLIGFNLEDKVVGIIGVGNIGAKVAKILNGFGMHVIAYDPSPSHFQHYINYVDLETLYAQADIISLHCPLMSATQYMINQHSINHMKQGVMLINTGRGGLIDTQAVIEALKNKKIGYLGLDVYEQEEALFFKDCSEELINDDIFERLITFPNVLITGHQGFFTDNALSQIAQTTLMNIDQCKKGLPLVNEI